MKVLIVIIILVILYIIIKYEKTIDKFGKEVTEKSNVPDKHVRFEKKNDKNQSDFNKGYKPSGKFIYGNDVLSTIKENS